MSVGVDDDRSLRHDQGCRCPRAVHVIAPPQLVADLAFPGAAVSWTAAMPAQQMDFDILTGPLELGRGAVKGAPYAAEAVSEVVQTLADGNRIVRSSTTAIYRDAEGRTRREQGLAIIGPLVGAADQTKHVVITDPEKGVTYILDPTTQTARRMPLPSFGTAGLRVGPGGPALPVPPASGDVLFFEAAVAARWSECQKDGHHAAARRSPG